ncbi:MAG: hypothetical protein HZC41_13435 [Chloroflexi bacterium]|nr:hypothetical protein [Chloroflexota bacterium]
MTNSFVQQHFPVFTSTQKMRDQLMSILRDDDLRFSLGGDTMTLGELCREMGEVEYSYLQSFKTGKQDWSYRNTEPGLYSSVEKLQAWFKALDEELNATVSGYSEDEINQTIDRGGGFIIPRSVQAHIYREALLIFYGKASVYLRAMCKPLPEQWRDWIG